MQKHSLNRNDLLDSLIVYLAQFPPLLGVEITSLSCVKQRSSLPVPAKKPIEKAPEIKAEILPPPKIKESKVSAPPTPKIRPYQPKETPCDFQEFAQLVQPEPFFLLPPCDIKAKLLQKDHSKNVFPDICLLISSTQKKDPLFFGQMEKLGLALKVYGSVSIVEIEPYIDLLCLASSFLLLRKETFDLFPDLFSEIDPLSEKIISWKEHSLLLLPSNDLYQILDVKKKIWHTLKSFFEA